jgi:hypothetical protein
VLPKAEVKRRSGVTRKSINEYLKATKEEKGKILDELTRVTGLHRQAATYRGLNPVTLLKQINNNLEQLWRLAERPANPGNRIYESTRRSSVTV